MMHTREQSPSRRKTKKVVVIDTPVSPTSPAGSSYSRTGSSPVGIPNSGSSGIKGSKSSSSHFRSSSYTPSSGVSVGQQQPNGQKPSSDSDSETIAANALTFVGA